MKIRNLILGIILCSLIFSASGVTKARADIAPPFSPDASNISPGEEQTMVQMVSEEVEINITGEKGVYYHYQFDYTEFHEVSGYEALVSASFTMRNRGEETETMAVHFPLTYGVYDYPREAYTYSWDFRVFVGGQELDWVEVEYPDSPFSWAKFDVTFPIDKNVVIKVNYTAYAEEEKGRREPQFTYILETGAGWYDSIGEADIILRLPYHASPENVFDYPEGAEFVGSEVHWHYEDLEPTEENNWHAKVVRPADWQVYVDAQKKSEQRPNDIDALVDYAWACYQISVSLFKAHQFYENTEHLFEDCKRLFSQAEELGADGLEFHTGIASVLLADHILNGEGTYNYVNANSPLIQKALIHIDKAIAIDPKNDLAWGLFYEIEYSSDVDLPEPGPSKTPTLTFTERPTRTITQTPTITLSPTSTLPPTRTPAITRTSKSSLPPTRTRTPAVVTRTPTLTSTPQSVIAGDNNAWLVGAIAVVALIALIGGGVVWIWAEKGKA